MLHKQTEKPSETGKISIKTEIDYLSHRFDFIVLPKTNKTAL